MHGNNDRTQDSSSSVLSSDSYCITETDSGNEERHKKSRLLNGEYPFFRDINLSSPGQHWNPNSHLFNKPTSTRQSYFQPIIPQISSIPQSTSSWKMKVKSRSKRKTSVLQSSRQKKYKKSKLTSRETSPHNGNHPKVDRDKLEQAVAIETGKIFATDNKILTSSEIPWKEVASHFIDVSTEECLKVWNRYFSNFVLQRGPNQQILCTKVIGYHQSVQKSKSLSKTEEKPNLIIPFLKKKETIWTDKEKEVVEALYKQIGSKWTLIGARLNTGKSVKEIKTYCLELRKQWENN